MAITHIELFSGIGGFRQAIDACGSDLGISFQCKGYSEIEPNAIKVYQALFDTSEEIEIGDIETFCYDKKEIKKLPQVSLVTGGFPCQSFSMMGKQKGLLDPRGNLFYRILDILKQTKPNYVVLENVKNLKTHDKGETFSKILSSLESLGYKVYSDIFNTSNFGIAQTRNRIYIFATKKHIPKEFNFNQKVIIEHYKSLLEKSTVSQKSVRDVLQKNVDSKYFLSPKLLKTILANGSANFHARSEINLPIARPLCATMAKMHRACQDNYYSQEFISGKSKGEVIIAPGKTNIRRLTPREAFKLQGVSNKSLKKIEELGLSDSALYKLAGNAVSVNVVYAIISYLSKTFSWSEE